MALTEQGRDFITGAIIGVDPNTNPSAPVLFNNANASVGVGDGADPFDATDVDLQGAVYPTNKDKKGMDIGYPIITGNSIRFRSTYGLTEGNFQWSEWAVFNFIGKTTPIASNGEYMMNRKAEELGTKVDVQTWEITVDLLVIAG